MVFSPVWKARNHCVLSGMKSGFIMIMMQMPIRAVKFFRRSANSLNDKAI